MTPSDKGKTTNVAMFGISVKVLKTTNVAMFGISVKVLMRTLTFNDLNGSCQSPPVLTISPEGVIMTANLILPAKEVIKC